MQPAVDMTNKAVIVTGAASGLGRATARALGKAGANLWLVDVNLNGLQDTVEELCAKGVNAQAQVVDLASHDDCRKVVSAAVAAFGRLDALCNVAGVLYLGKTPDMPTDGAEKVLAVNLIAPFYLIQDTIPHLIETEGAVVNVSSTAGFVGQAYSAVYCASKAGLIQMTKSLAMEYMYKPIRFNAVAPGGMETGLVAGMTIPEGIDLSLMQRYSGIRGLIEVEDVANTVMFLASPAARSFHGACISVDKGITAG